jgi:hypothetical protein
LRGCDLCGNGCLGGFFQMNKFKLMILLMAWDALEKSLDDLENGINQDNAIIATRAWKQFKEVWNS